MWKKAYAILLAIFACGLIYNWSFDYFMWYYYKKDAYEYMLNAETGRLNNMPSNFEFKYHRLQSLNRIIDDDAVMDSILIDFLRFRDDDGTLRNRFVQICAEGLIRETKRDSLQPYVDRLEDSIKCFNVAAKASLSDTLQINN